MSSQKIRNALGLLQDDEDNEAAWLELQDALTSPDVGLSDEELIDLLGAARRETRNPARVVRCRQSARV